MSKEIKIINCKCSDEDKEEIIEIIENSLEGKPAEISKTIKKRLDDKLGEAWQVIVGKSFSSYVTHEEEKFCHVSVDGMGIQVFKAGG